MYHISEQRFRLSVSRSSDIAYQLAGGLDDQCAGVQMFHASEHECR